MSINIQIPNWNNCNGSSLKTLINMPGIRKRNIKNSAIICNGETGSVKSSHLIGLKPKISLLVGSKIKRWVL